MKLSPETALFGLFGKPVSHSMGPLIHNTLFNRMDIDAVYLAFDIENIEKGVEAIKTLGIKGVSVTIPHKVSIMDYLDEIDPMAQKIGAVNTVLNKGGHLFGCNTDCKGAITPLKEITPIKDRKVLIFGAGGAARAVAFGIADEGGIITIVNRDQSKAESLSRQVGGTFLPYDQLNPSLLNQIHGVSYSDVDIVINCTSLGMHPNVDRSPLALDGFLNNGHIRPADTTKHESLGTSHHKDFYINAHGLPPTTNNESLDMSLAINSFQINRRETLNDGNNENVRRMTVMDIVYNPLDTKLLQDARECGFATIDGLAMFIHQGAEQFKLFTGQYPSVSTMRQIIEKKLRNIQS